MKSPVNFDIQMPNLNPPAAPSPSAASDSSGSTSSSASSKYAPSVPISVYRELAAELQNTRGKLDTLNTQNQQLVQQNQRLRQEIQKLAQSAVQTQQVIEALPAIRFDPATMSAQIPAEFDLAPDTKAKSAASPAARQKPAAKSTPKSTKSQPSSKRSPNGKSPSSAKSPEVYVIEQDDKRPVSASSKKASDMGGLWLAIAIILIIVSAFGAGFLIVRPFISSPASE